MTLQWIGIFPFALFCLVSVFTLAGLIFAYRALGILNKPFYQKTHKNIQMPLFLLIAYALLCIWFKQSISSGIVVFSDKDTPLLIDIVLGTMQLVGGMYVLTKILKAHDFFQGYKK